jgi:hypothetical protein
LEEARHILAPSHTLALSHISHLLTIVTSPHPVSHVLAPTFAPCDVYLFVDLQDTTAWLDASRVCFDHGYDTLLRLYIAALKTKKAILLDAIQQILAILRKQSLARINSFFTERAERQLQFLDDILRSTVAPTMLEKKNFIAAIRALAIALLDNFRKQWGPNPRRKELKPQYERSHTTGIRSQLLNQYAPLMTTQVQGDHQMILREPPVHDNLRGLLCVFRVLKRQQDQCYLEKDLQNCSVLPWGLMIPLAILESPLNRIMRPTTENDIHGTDPIILSQLGLPLCLVSSLEKHND